jgi:hypothetical protein
MRRAIMATAKLWTVGNPKTAKGEARGFLTAVLHLAPHTLGDGRRNVCPHASAECIALCLNTAGRGGIFKHGETTNVIQEARKRRTVAFWADRDAFALALLDDAQRVARMAKREGLRLAFRLNGTSDLDWQRIAPVLVSNLADLGVLYDYTKDARKAARDSDPIDYTLSWSGTNAAECAAHVARNGRVAVVFGKVLPATFLGVPVVDGDAHDLRFLNPGGVVVGLRAKGKARKHTGAFVVRDAV